MLSDHRLTVVCILLLGALLRIHALMDEVRFHPDEALFATFARNAAVHGDWMLSGALDKPPLSLYAAAFSMQFTGVYVNPKNVLDLDVRQGEFAARLPNVFAGLVLVALVYAFAYRRFDERSAQFAALLTALSPQLVAFSATAFTDTLMLTLMIAALVAAARGHPLWSGVWLALAVWSKQQGMFYLPLVVVILVQKPYPLRVYRVQQKDRGFKPLVNTDAVWRLTRFFVAFACGIALLVVWDAARQPNTSLFALAAVNNNPERLFIRADELLPRVLTWLGYMMTFFGAWWLTLPLVVFGIWAAPQNRGRLFALALYIGAYFGLHWVITFNTYDRYLLPIIPLLAILIGYGLAQAKRFRAVLMIGLSILMVSAPIHFPTDSRARDDEIIQLAHHLNAKPLGAILYDHWLGWEMGYYIGAWSDKRRVYYPEPQRLSDDALLNPDPAPRYVIAPMEQDVSAWLNALRENDFEVRLDYRSRRYVVYRVTPAWCC